jgi:hypothetical protein
MARSSKLVIAVAGAAAAGVAVASMAVSWATVGGEGGPATDSVDGAAGEVAAVPAGVEQPTVEDDSAPSGQFGRGEVERLSICVDGSPAASEAEMARVADGAAGLRWWHDQAEEAIVAAETETEAEGGGDGHAYTPVEFAEPEVVAGCPGGAVLPPEDTNQGARVRQDPVETASEHQVHVYLLTDEEAARSAGLEVESYRRVAYEVACASEHVCGEATVALFVRRTSVTDADQVSELLARATGMYYAVRPAAPPAGEPPGDERQPD